MTKEKPTQGGAAPDASPSDPPGKRGAQHRIKPQGQRHVPDPRVWAVENYGEYLEPENLHTRLQMNLSLASLYGASASAFECLMDIAATRQFAGWEIDPGTGKSRPSSGAPQYEDHVAVPWWVVCQLAANWQAFSRGETKTFDHAAGFRVGQGRSFPGWFRKLRADVGIALAVVISMRQDGIGVRSAVEAVSESLKVPVNDVWEYLGRYRDRLALRFPELATGKRRGRARKST